MIIVFKILGWTHNTMQHHLCMGRYPILTYLGSFSVSPCIHIVKPPLLINAYFRPNAFAVYTSTTIYDFVADSPAEMHMWIGGIVE